MNYAKIYTNENFPLYGRSKVTPCMQGDICDIALYTCGYI